MLSRSLPLLAAAAVCLHGAAAANPPAGTRAVSQDTYTDDGLEPGSQVSSRKLRVTWPSDAHPGESFPLLVYAHGAAGGGDLEVVYNRHFKDMAAYGFVVVAPMSCILGCGLVQWQRFVYENTRAIQWARNQSSGSTMPWTGLIDNSHGVAFASHSMGGMSGVQAGWPEFAAKYDIRATVVQHGYRGGLNATRIGIPLLAMTGGDDVIVFPYITKGIYTEDAGRPKTFRNQKGKGHLEMLTLGDYNPAVASHTAAFFKVHLLGDKGTYYDQVYGTGPDSVCGYASMNECEHVMQ